MKKAIALLMTFVLLFSLFACSDEKDISNKGFESEKAIQCNDESIMQQIAEIIKETIQNTELCSIPTVHPETGTKNYDAFIEYLSTRISCTSAQFAFELLKEAIKYEPNAVISPVSIITALSMVANGANGKTLTEMENTLGSTLNNLKEDFGSYARKVNTDTADGIKTANSVWFNNRKNLLAVNKSFIGDSRQTFGAEIFKEEFNNITLKKINDWVSKNTDGTINNMLPEIPDRAVAYIINTVLFDAEWKVPYTEPDIRENQIFVTEDGRKQSVTMLNSTESLIRPKYFRLGKTTVACREYTNGYSFAAMLPDEGVTIEQALNSFNGATFISRVTDTNTDENGNVLDGIYPVILSLPKFEFQCKFKLAEILKNMGMEAAFDSQKADFSGMAISSQGNIYINEVFHNTYISLGEKGTKAGAATATSIFGAGALPKMNELIFNRPFIYVIYSPDGMPLFAGVVRDFDAA